MSAAALCIGNAVLLLKRAFAGSIAFGFTRFAVYCGGADVNVCSVDDYVKVYRFLDHDRLSVEVLYTANYIGVLKEIVTGPACVYVDIDETLVSGPYDRLREHIIRKYAPRVTENLAAIVSEIRERGLDRHGYAYGKIIEPQSREVLDGLEEQGASIVFLTARSSARSNVTRAELEALGLMQPDGKRRLMHSNAYLNKGVAIVSDYRRLMEERSADDSIIPRRIVFADNEKGHIADAHDEVLSGLHEHIDELTTVHYIGALDTDSDDFRSFALS